MARIPYAGLTLTEAHSTKMELLLTEFVLSQMQMEGSTYYRADALSATSAANAEESGPEAKAKAKPKPKSTPKVKGTPKPKSSAGAPETGEIENGADPTGEDDEELPW